MAQQHQVGTVATTVRRHEGRLSVVYHATEVVSVNATGAITLDSGGYRTHTTKTRMNQASNQYGLGFQVFAKDFSWYVRIWNGDVIAFVDGMTFESR